MNVRYIWQNNNNKLVVPMVEVRLLATCMPVIVIEVVVPVVIVLEVLVVVKEVIVFEVVVDVVNCRSKKWRSFM